MASDTPPTRTDTAIKVALSLVPYVGGSLSTLYGDLVERRRARVERFAQAAFTAYQGSPDDFIAQLRNDDRLAELFLIAVESASRSARNDKISALSQLLAQAASVRDGGAYDEEELLINALAELEWPHIKALKELAQHPSDKELEFEGLDSTAMSSDPRRKARFDSLDRMPTPVTQVLIRNGLLSQEAGFGLYVAGVSSFGRRALEYLESW